MNRLRIVVAGSSGRMGRTLIEAVIAAPDMELIGALEQPKHPLLGKKVREFLGLPSDIAVSEDIVSTLKQADYFIDFTQPQGTLAHVRECIKAKVKMVIGTTGFSEGQKKEILEASRQIAIVNSPNMSVGVNLVFKLLELAAKTLGDNYDVEIIEAHHRQKVDAPSGTALHMGKILADALDRNLATCAMYGREGIVGPRDSKTIGFATVRAGDIVGDHTILFAGTGERIEITHRSNSRATYAQGALRAIRFLMDKATGLYDMQQVLNLH